MANLLYQQIEMLSREKHIEPEVVVSAIEDAMVVAARKHYKTEEDLRAKFNQETGQVEVFSVMTVVEEVVDPKKELRPRTRRRRTVGGSRHGDCCEQADRCVRAHYRADVQAFCRKCARPSAIRFSTRT